MVSKQPVSLVTTGQASELDPAGSEKPWSASVVGESATVVSNAGVNAEYRHLVVACSAASAAAAPGQFFQLLCPHTEGAQPFLRRPMSLYGADPERKQVEFLYKVTGAGTLGLSTLRPGDSLDIMGPLGVGFTLDSNLRHIVAIGRGAGLATLAPLAKAAKANGTATRLSNAVRSAKYRVFRRLRRSINRKRLKEVMRLNVRVSP